MSQMGDFDLELFKFYNLEFNLQTQVFIEHLNVSDD